MNTARQAQPQSKKPDLKQRATASRASAARHLEASEGIGSLPAACAASKLGELLDKAWARREELDEQTTPENRLVLEPIEKGILRRIDDLEVAISYARAASPAGVLIQLAIAADGVDMAANGTDYSICSSGQDKVERCLHSVAAAICAWSGINREGFSVSRYLPARCDELAVLDGAGGEQ